MIFNASRRAGVAVALMLAVAGCGSDETSQPTAGTPLTPAPAKCSDVFQVGKKIDQNVANAGCTDPDGGIHGVGAHRCNDGRHLWQVDASTGAPLGWGFGGDVYHASKTKDIAADPAYKKAYDSCVS